MAGLSFYAAKPPQLAIVCYNTITQCTGTCISMYRTTVGIFGGGLYLANWHVLPNFDRCSTVCVCVSSGCFVLLSEV